jgi:hypothetical protein
MASKLKNKRGYLWVTLGLFVISISLHWTFAWYAYVQDQREHNQPIQLGNYFNETFRDTMENWQSEFLQLMWQVGGLSILWYVGSPQSKEGDERKEEKLDAILKRLDPVHAHQIIQELEQKYPKK